LDSFEAGERESGEEKSSVGTRFHDTSSATFKKDRRINVRISSRDLDALQKRALEEGLPYQTLISSIPHQDVSGRLRAENA